MYINLVECSGVPEFYAKGSAGLGEFYYIDMLLIYFPYPDGYKELSLPTEEDGTLSKITVRGFLHSEEYEAPMTCMDCGGEFAERTGWTYVTATSYHRYQPEINLENGEEKQTIPTGVFGGDIQSVRELPRKDRSIHTARIAVKDTSADIGFSYMTVSSLHPIHATGGDRLLAKGRLAVSQYRHNTICPHCGYVGCFVSDSVTIQASAIQLINTDSMFQELSTKKA